MTFTQIRKDSKPDSMAPQIGAIHDPRQQGSSSILVTGNTDRHPTMITGNTDPLWPRATLIRGNNRLSHGNLSMIAGHTGRQESTSNKDRHPSSAIHQHGKHRSHGPRRDRGQDRSASIQDQGNMLGHERARVAGDRRHGCARRSQVRPGQTVTVQQQ